MNAGPMQRVVMLTLIAAFCIGGCAGAPVATRPPLTKDVKQGLGTVVLLKGETAVGADFAMPHGKIGGVLIETLLTADRGAWVIAGFGVNHGHRRAELPTPTATSLRCEVAGELPSLPAMAASLLDGLEAGLRHPPPAEQIVDDFRALAIHRPGDAMRCEVAGGVYNGAFAGFDEHGFLRLLTDTGEIRLLAGEILER